MLLVDFVSHFPLLTLCILLLAMNSVEVMDSFLTIDAVCITTGSDGDSETLCVEMQV